MTKFNPENKEVLTYGEILDSAMNITDKKDAMQYKAAYIDYIQKALDKENKDGHTALEIANANFGYWAGYGSDKTRARIEELFECSHPVFGSIKLNGSPSNEKALSMGMQAGAKSKNN